MFCSGDGERLITCVHGDVVMTEHCGQELCRMYNSSPYCLVSTAPDPLCNAMGLYRRCVGNESVACIDQARTTSSLDCAASGQTCQPDGSCQ